MEGDVQGGDDAQDKRMPKLGPRGGDAATWRVMLRVGVMLRVRLMLRIRRCSN